MNSSVKATFVCGSTMFCVPTNKLRGRLLEAAVSAGSCPVIVQDRDPLALAAVLHFCSTGHVKQCDMVHAAEFKYWLDTPRVAPVEQPPAAELWADCIGFLRCARPSKPCETFLFPCEVYLNDDRSGTSLDSYKYVLGHLSTLRSCAFIEYGLELQVELLTADLVYAKAWHDDDDDAEAENYYLMTRTGEEVLSRVDWHNWTVDRPLASFPVLTGQLGCCKPPTTLFLPYGEDSVVLTLDPERQELWACVNRSACENSPAVANLIVLIWRLPTAQVAEQWQAGVQSWSINGLSSMQRFDRYSIVQKRTRLVPEVLSNEELKGFPVHQGMITSWVEPAGYSLGIAMYQTGHIRVNGTGAVTIKEALCNKWKTQMKACRVTMRTI